MSQRHAEHWIVKTGNYYLTYCDGYSLDLDKAMFVREDIKLVGNQELVRIRVRTRIELMCYKL